MMNRFKIREDGSVFPLAANPPMTHLCGLLGVADKGHIYAAEIANSNVLIVRKYVGDSKLNLIATALMEHGHDKNHEIYGPAVVLPIKDVLGMGLYIDPAKGELHAD